MSTTVTTFSIPQIQPDATGSQVIAQINGAFSTMQTFLETVSDQLSSVNRKSAVVRQFVPIDKDSNVGVGTLVYYDPDKALFCPAQALLADTASNGSSVEALCARVEGLIVSVDSTGTTGTMLCNGYWESIAVAEACLGAQAIPGTYYLSPWEPGKAVKDTKGRLQQAILTYYGAGKIGLNLFYLAHDNHFHMSAVLDKSCWMPVTELASVVPTGTDTPTIPDGALWVYDTRLDPSFTGFTTFGTATSAIFINGILQPDVTTGSTCYVSNAYLWCNDQTPPESDTIAVFTHFPYAYGSPVVRDVASTNAALRVHNRNGIVQITPNAFIGGATNRNALAISGISGNTVLFTPVVTGLGNGPGIDIARLTDGTAIISSASRTGIPIDAYSINHNGTTITSDNNYQYITFPAGRNSSLVLTLPLPDIPQGTTVAVTAWGMVLGESTSLDVILATMPEATANTPVELPNLDVMPTQAGTSDTISSTDAITKVQTTLAATGEAGKVSFVETAAAVRLTGPQYIVAKISCTSAPANGVKFLRMGFRVVPVAANLIEVPEQEITKSAAITGQLAAGYTVSALDIVCIKNGQLQLCRSTDASTANQCVGVAIASGNVGETVEYVLTGIITDISAPFTPGNPVFVGPNGRLAQSAPTEDNSAYSQKIGMALTTSAVQIQIEPAIVFGE